MAKTKRTKIQIQKDRLRIAELLLSGRTTEREIGAELGLTQQMVSYDKKVIEKEWKQSREKDMDLLVAREIKIIEKLYREALRGWERSLGIKSKTKAKKSQLSNEKKAETASKTTENLTGDVRFITAARELRRDFRDLLGLDQPKKISGTLFEGKIDYSSCSLDQLTKLRMGENPLDVLRPDQIK